MKKNANWQRHTMTVNNLFKQQNHKNSFFLAFPQYPEKYLTDCITYSWQFSENLKTYKMVYLRSQLDYFLPREVGPPPLPAEGGFCRISFCISHINDLDFNWHCPILSVIV